MKNTLLSILLLGGMVSLYSQSDPIDPIEQIVDQIDNDRTLSVKEVDATEVYGHAVDGGGVIRVYFDQNEIKKIVEEIGLSFGMTTKVIYIEKGMPIKIIDREENFQWSKNKKGWDRTSMNEVFQTEIYIFDWDTDKTRAITKGKRHLSEATSSVFAYEPLIGLGVHLWKK
jgi:hypothetical protein